MTTSLNIPGLSFWSDHLPWVALVLVCLWAIRRLKVIQTAFRKFGIKQGRFIAMADTAGITILLFILVSSLAYATQQHLQEGNTGWVVFDGGLTLMLWSADIYGAWWTARHLGS